MKRKVALVALAGLVVAFAAAVAVQMGRGGGGEGGARLLSGGAPAAAPTPGAAREAMGSAPKAQAVESQPATTNDAYGAVIPSGGDQTLPAQFLDRKIAMSGSMDLQVQDVGGAFEDIRGIATAAGGFIAGSTFGYQGDNQVASVTIRVPVNRFQDVLADVRRLAERLDSEQATSQDLTEEYTDLQSQARNLQATEQRYLDLLARAQSINDILQLEDRLTSVRGQIEQLQGRVNAINNTTDMSTLTVHLKPVAAVQKVTQEATGGPHPLRAAGEAWEASLTVLSGVAAGVLVVLVFSWWLVPLLALVAVAAVRLLRSRRPQAAT